MYATNVRDFAMILSKSFRIEEAEVDGKRICYFYYDDDAPQKTLEMMKESFSFYEEKFGAYPHPMYAMAQSGLCLDATRFSCLSFLSDKCAGENKARIIAREIARQWSGLGVGMDPITNAWQEEGLAEYMALTFFENYEKYGWTRDGLLKEAMLEYRSYYDVYGSVLGRTDTRMTRDLGEYLSEYEYKCLARDKAVVMLDSLRKSIGDEKFFASLKRYYRENAHRQTATGDLIASFEKTGVDVGGFFDGFLSGKGIL